MSEREHKITPKDMNIDEVVCEVINLDAEDTEKLLFELGKYFATVEEELTNMKANVISYHLLMAAKEVQKRTSN